MSLSKIMENNQRVNEAIDSVFAELFAMTSQELDARLAKREIGSISQFLLDRGTLDNFSEEDKTGFYEKAEKTLMKQSA
jgi:hypothetical protein